MYTPPRFSERLQAENLPSRVEVRQARLAAHTQMMAGVTSRRLSPCSYWDPGIHTPQHIACKPLSLCVAQFFFPAINGPPKLLPGP